jgi:hypothetical protein
LILSCAGWLSWRWRRPKRSDDPNQAKGGGGIMAGFQPDLIFCFYLRKH